jgi:hypothetical protein
MPFLNITIITSLLLLLKGLQSKPFYEDSEHKETKYDQRQHYRLLVNVVFWEIIRHFNEFVLCCTVVIRDNESWPAIKVQIAFTLSHLQRRIIIKMPTNFYLYILSTFRQN